MGGRQLSEAIYIDGEPLSDYGGQLVDWNFGNSLTNSILTGKNNALPSLLRSDVAQGTLTATIHVTGRNTSDAHMKASRLVCRLNKTTDLQMPDGMLYRSALTKCPQTDFTRWIVELSCEFTAVKHEPYVEINPYVSGNLIAYDGTAPAGVKIEFDAPSDIQNMTLKIVKNLETKFGTSVKFSDAAELYRALISGNQTQEGTGDPSFENVRPIHGVTKITVGGVDYVLPRELFTDDYYDPIPAQGQAEKNKIVFDGSTDEGWTVRNTNADYIRFGTILANAGGLQNKVNCASENLTGLSFESLYELTNEGIGTWIDSTNTSWVGITILKYRLTGWSDSWTDAQKNAAFNSLLSSNPVTVVYELATPQPITGTPIPSAVPADTLISVDNGGTVTTTSGNTQQDIQLTSIPSGSHISIDGIDGKITQNGVNKFADSNLVDFPAFDPPGGTYAVQTDTAVSNLKIGYYPAYL